jgi:hypothetical protein
MALQILLFVATIVGFGLWAFGTSALGIWIAYAVALVVLLEVGGHSIQWYMERTLRSLSDSAVGPNMRDAATAIENMFHREGILYVAVPLGLLLGTIVGLFRRESPQEIMGLCLLIVLLVASAVLLGFLIYGCVRMADPLFKRASVTSTMIADEPLRERTGPSGTVLRVVASGTPSETDDQDETNDQDKEDFDLASVATDLRKIYLCDALHNLILIAAFAAVMLSLWGITVGVVLFAVGAVGLAFVFNQLPYMIGQQRLRGELLKNYRNSKRVDMAEELKKYAPLFPTLEFLTVLVSSPTASGAVYYLCANLLERLKL